MTNAKPDIQDLRKALSSEDPVAEIRELIPDDGGGAQSVVVHAFACILETGSAGLSILFDRFDDSGLDRIDAALTAIGADRTLAGLRELRDAVARGVAGGQDRLEASQFVAGHEIGQRIDAEAEAQIQELETKLLQYCSVHLEELAG